MPTHTAICFQVGFSTMVSVTVVSVTSTSGHLISAIILVVSPSLRLNVVRTFFLVESPVMGFITSTGLYNSIALPFINSMQSKPVLTASIRIGTMVVLDCTSNNDGSRFLAIRTRSDADRQEDRSSNIISKRFILKGQVIFVCHHWHSRRTLRNGCSTATLSGNFPSV